MKLFRPGCLFVALFAMGISAPGSNAEDVVIEAATHHLGDAAGNEGIIFQKSFALTAIPSAASLELSFIQPFGPNYENPPQLFINGESAGSIQPFFPPLDTSSPLWQTNPDGSHDYNGAFRVSLPVSSLLLSGENTFRIQNGRPDDDYYFNNVFLRISTCKVGPLAALTDPAAISFESGNTIDTAHLDPAMKTALAVFQEAVEDRGGHFKLNSAYRPSQYQAHLREVWDKWMRLKNNSDADCQALRSQVEAEFGAQGHQLLLTQRPAGPGGPHTKGAAIDVSVNPAVTGLPLATMLSDACVAGLFRRLPTSDRVHFEFGTCTSPPQQAPERQLAILTPPPANKTVSGQISADVTVQVSAEDMADGTERYRYILSNRTGQDVVGLFIGYYADESELLTAPLGWDVDTGIPTSSIEKPLNWHGEVFTTEERPYLSLLWMTDAPEFALHTGATVNSFSVLLDTKRQEYASAHWTVILADGQTVSGQVNAVSPHFGNISTRLHVGAGDKVMIAGFIIEGSASKKVLIRAAGPSLTKFGVRGVLANPQIELHDASDIIGTNDDWETTQIGGVITSNQEADIQLSMLAPADSLESAMIATLSSGSYTAIVRGANSTTGVGIVELYDLSPNNGSSLANISTRGFIQTEDNVMIGGFIVVTQPLRVVIRAIGPSLTQLGVPDALANPQLELHDANGTIAINNDWQTTQIGGIITTDQVEAIQNSMLAPSKTAESGIIATLVPGNYTAIVQGVGATTGVALVEVYALP
jgi:hypothetical protein